MIRPRRFRLAYPVPVSTRLLFAILALVVFAVGINGYLAGGTPATQASLAAARLPPLIPVRQFYANASRQWGFQPSHDGSMIAWYAVEWEKTVIRVGTVGESGLLATLPANDVDEFYWDPFKNLLLLAMGGKFWKVDPLHPTKDAWVDITPRGFNAWTIQRLPLEPDHRLVVFSNDREAALQDVYEVRQDGGGKELLFRNEGRTVNWWFDQNNIPILRMDRAEDGSSRLLANRQGGQGWTPLLEVASGDQFLVSGTPTLAEPFLAISNRGRDRLALVRVDPTTGGETVIFEHPKVDVGSLTWLGQQGFVPDVVTVWDGFPERRAFTPAGEAFLKLLGGDKDPVDVVIIGSSSDGRFVTVARSAHDRPYAFLLYDLRDGTALPLAQDMLLDNEGPCESKPVSFSARDGLEIPAVLVMPRAIPARRLPAVVVVHGGPLLQDVWGYNPDYQFLCKRGYVVLSVNFRGSTGYGKAFRDAGYGQVGGAMQDDIVDAAKWLADNDIADPDNMAVMGGSYGGYSAALAMTRDPGTFKAAVVDYALLDVPYQMKNRPFSWELSLDEIKRFFGDPSSPSDLQAMWEMSPLAKASNAEGSILLTVGKDDNVVGFEQTEEFERALAAAGKDVKAVYFEKEGHGYSRWQTRLVHARLVEDFLASQIGGRSGGFDYTELVARYLD